MAVHDKEEKKESGFRKFLKPVAPKEAHQGSLPKILKKTVGSLRVSKEDLKETGKKIVHGAGKSALAPVAHAMGKSGTARIARSIGGGKKEKHHEK